MPPHPITDPEHWRQRAQEMRDLAAEVQDPLFKQTMLRIAADYDRLATRAEERTRGERP
jgi:hypothetical protein